MFLLEIHRVLSLKMDFTGESPSEKLIRNALLQRCLSMQYALDFRGNSGVKTLSGKLAWTTLHLRVASLASGLTWAPAASARQRQGPPQPEDNFKPGSLYARSRIFCSNADHKDTEAMQSLLGLVKWFVDIMCLVVSDLIELSDATKDRWNDLEFVRQKSELPLLIPIEV